MLFTDARSDPIRCIVCESKVSWQYCTANATKQTCPSDFDRCGQSSFEYNSIKVFSKGCRKTKTCEEKGCEKETVIESGGKCFTTCCKGDFCNADDQVAKDGELKCYECKSSVSKEDCEKNKKVKTCAQGEDRCSESMAVDPSHKLYARECATKEVCAKGGEVFCDRWKEQGESAECAHRCCSGDLCNSAEASESQLKCFECHSGNSWEDCERNKKSESCDYGQFLCITLSTVIETKHTTMKTYRRGCEPAAKCASAESTCDLYKKKFGDDTKCKIDSKCCSGNLCNTYSSGHTSLISGLVLLSCATATFSNLLH